MKNLTVLPLDSGMMWSSYTILKNQIPITLDYIANDTGIWLLEGRNKKLVCEPFSIDTIVRDRNNGTEYVEISFIDYSTGKGEKISKQLETPALFDKQGINILRGEGFSVANDNLFKTLLSVVKANLNRITCMGIETPTKRHYGSTKYGFEIINGEVNYDNFVGIDSQIIPSNEYKKYDKVLFKTAGTLEGQKEYLAEFLKDSPCKTFIKQATAAALTGITRMFLTNREDMPCAVYNFSAHTSFGKTYLQKIEIGLYGDNRSASPISQSADTSPAASRRIKARLNLIYIEDDWTDFTKRKDGLDTLQDKIYENSNGCNVGKANSNGTLREDVNTWGCTMISFSENNNMILTLQNGADGRVLSFDSNVSIKSPLMIYGPVSKKPLINKMQSENYGHIVPAYVKALKGRQEEITERFTDLAGKYKDKLKCTDKVSSLYAMLDLTYALAFEAKLFPESWGELTFNDMIGQYDADRIVDTEETLYKLLCERILSQSNVFIDENVKLTKEQYEERMNNNQTVRGRVSIKEMDDGRRLKIATVPTDVVDRNIIDLEKTYGINQQKISAKAWIKAGWLIPTSKGYGQHTCSNITRQYIKGETKMEMCYKIILEDLTPSEEEKAKAQAQKEQLQEKRKENLNALRDKYLEPEEGLMYIP